MAVIAPLVAPYDPVAQDLAGKLAAPSLEHWFGTDNFGRDIFSRVIYGGRYSLLAGCLTVIIAGCIGKFYGAVAGYVGEKGRYDHNACSSGSDSLISVADPGDDYQCDHGSQPL